MYSQLLYFIVALLFFTIQQPGVRPLLPPLQTLLLALGVFLLYVMFCRLAFRSLQRSLWLQVPLSAVTLQYHRVQNRLSILALGALAVYIYILNIKFYLRAVPGFEESLTLSGIAGLGLYLLHLGVIWFWSHPVYQRIHRSDVERAAFVKGHFAFSSAILIPWLLISLIFDLLQFLKIPLFLQTELGQFILFYGVLVVLILLAPWLVVRLWGCEAIPYNAIAEDLYSFCREFRFRVGKLLLWPLFGGETLTAGVIGILPPWRYILFTRGLLDLLGSEELKAVVAHEMGHVRRFHLLLYLAFFACFSVLTSSFQEILFLLLLKQDTFLHWAVSPGTLHQTLFSLVCMIPVIILLVFYFRYIFGYFMRNSERQADLYALKLIGHPFTLISSLRKIAYASGQIEDLPSWHHFGIRQRIDFLLAAHQDQVLARKHHQKLYVSALLFLTLVLSLSALGSHLQKTRTIRLWRNEIQLSMLEKEMSLEPGKPELYNAYGGLLLEKGRYAEARVILHKALELAPQEASILNNLAWLYATAPAPYRHPARALELALEAAAQKSEPYILDTLAEAYYVNGKFVEALRAIEKALLQQPQNRDYFVGQKRKFEDALRNEKDLGAKKKEG